ncbi:MAG: Undecaprenol kinase [uncultured bacterium]|nr:MAG: Undecaprenol kinase [uncultured bacterium]
MLKHSISFKHAFTGIWTALTSQLNLRIHFLIGSLVLFGAVYFQCSSVEVLILILTIMIVMVAEMYNTALEFLSDGVTYEHHDYIKYAKDVSAGAVLLSAIFATLVGLIIFIPKIL